MITSHFNLDQGLTRILRTLTPSVNAVGTAVSLAPAALIRYGRASYKWSLALYRREPTRTVLLR
jgi:hypothetical protein